MLHMLSGSAKHLHELKSAESIGDTNQPLPPKYYIK